MSLHPHVAGLIVVLDPKWRRKIFVGGLVLMIPVIGWPAVLGYRSHCVQRLFRDTGELLPGWRAGFWRHVIDGWKAMGVIFGHLAPLYVALGVLVWERGWRPDSAWVWWMAFFVVFPGFSPLTLPIACVVFTLSPVAYVGSFEAALLLAAFAFTIFIIPVGFLEVSRTGRYRSAFAFQRTWPFAWRHRRDYTAAWGHSLLQAAVGHGCFPLTPWGVVWCFLSIVALFNEILVRTGDAPGIGWLQRGLADERFVPPPNLGRFARMDGSGAAFTACNLGAFSLPLPALLTTAERS